MGLFSGSASFVRYSVGEGIPDTVKEFALAKLKEFAFKEIEPGSLNEKSIGWVSAENMASTFFDDLHFARDPYLVFSLRMDVRKIPSLTMKAALLREEIKHKAATGRERLSKKDRDMLKDEVWQALTRKALPTPAVYDACWNTRSNIVLFFSTGSKANEEFMSFFYRSFDSRLTPLMPHELARHLGARSNRSIDVNDSAIRFIDE